MARQTQAERSDATTSALVTAGLSLFGRDGYAATSMDAVAAAAGLTKGAAYHHFGGKAALFRAVLVRQEEVLAKALTAAAAAAPDSWTALRAGCHAFLEQSLDPQVRRIVLLDGPAALGWEAVREIEYEHTLRLLRLGIDNATRDGFIRPADPAISCQLLFGALCEAGMLLARSDDAAATLPRVAAEADRLLRSLTLSD
ncbi:TetR/AcrR family transcriptional regulator [Kribbella sp. NPDC051586]|uniref:TetR/AcrR family transcriptional regulator n=1 Tax=Kribbella sp. NPDC051586 TaxID=3364118 RepID=UPI003793D64F